MSTKRCVCIIPARGGSKRIPRKNILPLNGIPLIAYTIRAAKNSDKFAKIVVSTEDKEIAAIAISEGVEVDKRPENMAGDTVTKVQVVEEYLMRTNAAQSFEHVAALLPTCPFRSTEDVVNAVDLFNQFPEKNYLIGVVEYEFPVQLALEKISDHEMKMVDSSGYKTTRSQNISKRFHPNGSIYMATIDAFLKTRTFFNDTMLTYEMPAIRSFDIDYPYQFEIAEIMARKLSNGNE
ncbi:MAG: acylneuraminate cytidylyltransferase family protein [Flavobacteriales bacterium]